MVQYITIPMRKNAASRLQKLRYGISIHTERDWGIYIRKKHRKQ